MDHPSRIYDPGYGPAMKTTRHSQRSSTSAAATSTASQEPHILNPSSIAGITMGVLGAAVLAFFILGTIINYFYVRRRARQSERIEAQHRRWPSLDSRFPPRGAPMQAHGSNQWDVEKSAMTYPTMQQPDTGSRVKPENIGVAVSPETATMESPESYQSQSSVAKLLLSNQAKAPIGAYPPSKQQKAPERGTQPATAALIAPTEGGSSLRPRQPAPVRPSQPAPARLRIANDNSAPPPVRIFPPGISAPDANARGLVVPSIPHIALSRPDSLGIEHRKETPSYLVYYTNPTPPAPVAPHVSNHNGNDSTQRDQPAAMRSPSDPELDPSSASSNGSDTSFESAMSDEVTPTEPQGKHIAPIVTSPELQLKNIRYPEIPRPSNQQPSRTSSPGSNSNHSHNVSGGTNVTSTTANSGSLLEKRRGQTTATELEKKLWITESNVRRPSPPKVLRHTAGNVTQWQHWPLRSSSKEDPVRPNTDEAPVRESKLTPRLLDGNMILEISSP